jgi:hypothetical protein
MVGSGVGVNMQRFYGSHADAADISHHQAIISLKHTFYSTIRYQRESQM